MEVLSYCETVTLSPTAYCSLFYMVVVGCVCVCAMVLSWITMSGPTLPQLLLFSEHFNLMKGTQPKAWSYV